jgi:hypothetical protein
MVIGKPRRTTPDYDRAPFFLWEVKDEDFTTGEKIGPVSVSGLASSVHDGDEFVFSPAPQSPMPEWFHEWAGAMLGGKIERLLLLRDARGKRWIALRACLSYESPTIDRFGVIVQGCKALDEAPLFVDE